MKIAGVCVQRDPGIYGAVVAQLEDRSVGDIPEIPKPRHMRTSRSRAYSPPLSWIE
jgi:hypothetical protein